uniref:Uncharacterized protein n=1 Tax=Brassica oleracea var. oleracea TaxID=109376 RepID=A0A0D2ZU73_BRAOL
MNLQLGNTEEYIDGQLTGNLREILIRRKQQVHASADLQTDITLLIISWKYGISNLVEGQQIERPMGLLMARVI